MTFEKFVTVNCFLQYNNFCNWLIWGEFNFSELCCSVHWQQDVMTSERTKADKTKMRRKPHTSYLCFTFHFYLSLIGFGRANKRANSVSCMFLERWQHFPGSRCSLASCSNWSPCLGSTSYVIKHLLTVKMLGRTLLSRVWGHSAWDKAA